MDVRRGVLVLVMSGLLVGCAPAAAHLPRAAGAIQSHPAAGRTPGPGAAVARRFKSPTRRAARVLGGWWRQLADRHLVQVVVAGVLP